ncbi:MAG: hypothetical protein GVY10_09050 [Verrucomicrobia bacterium]|jgi:hypothetical protein|nr:hypothetical protein [Verrucomicrobiota bacterium]
MLLFPIAASSALVENLHHITGFLIVVVVLVILWALTVLISRIPGVGATAPQTAVARAQPSPASAPREDMGELTEEEVVAISASVVALTGYHSKVVSVQPATRDWSREGRREHFASHRIR